MIFLPAINTKLAHCMLDIGLCTNLYFILFYFYPYTSFNHDINYWFKKWLSDDYKCKSLWGKSIIHKNKLVLTDNYYRVPTQRPLLFIPQCLWSCGISLPAVIRKLLRMLGLFFAFLTLILYIFNKCLFFLKLSILPPFYTLYLRLNLLGLHDSTK